MANATGVKFMTGDCRLCIVPVRLFVPVAVETNAPSLTDGDCIACCYAQ